MPELEVRRMDDALHEQTRAWPFEPPWQSFRLGPPPITPERSHWAAVDGDGRAVGQFALQHSPAVAPYLYVSAFYVPPELRGRGLGRAILRRMYEAHPGRHFLGEVVGWNTRALALYLREGWVVTDTRWQKGNDAWAEVIAPALGAPVSARPHLQAHLAFVSWRWAYRGVEVAYWAA